MSSHNAGVIQDWSTRVVWMDKGRVRADGDPATVLEEYAASQAV